jgi:hypothetical protein
MIIFYSSLFQYSVPYSSIQFPIPVINKITEVPHLYDWKKMKNCTRESGKDGELGEGERVGG